MPSQGRGAPNPSADGRGVFRRVDRDWDLRYAGQSVRVRHAKGLVDLARLLDQPGRPIHVSELITVPTTADVVRVAADDGATGRDLRKRLADLAAEFDQRLTRDGATNISRRRDDFLESMPRTADPDGDASDDPIQRARKTVAARIRNSIIRIGHEHAALARHLERSVDTGVWCVYRPETWMEWQT